MNFHILVVSAFIFSSSVGLSKEVTSHDSVSNFIHTTIETVFRDDPADDNQSATGLAAEEQSLFISPKAGMVWTWIGSVQVGPEIKMTWDAQE